MEASAVLFIQQLGIGDAEMLSQRFYLIIGYEAVPFSMRRIVRSVKS